MANSVEEHRRRLAALLRRHRKAAGLTGTELAAQLGWSQSRISRMETGQQSPSEYEAREISRVGLSRKALQELIEAVHQFDVEFVATRAALSKGAQQRQDEIRAIEASSSSVNVVSLSLVPGLLQVPDYVRALCSVDPGTADWTTEQIEGAVALRKERQQALTSKKKTFSFLLSDACLYLRYGSASAQRAQLEYLLECTSSKSFKLGIIPRTASLTTIPLTGFKIYDDRLVQVDGLTGEFNVIEELDVRRYQQSFDRLSSSAATGKSARRLIDEALAELL